MRPSILSLSAMLAISILVAGCAGDKVPNLMNLRSDSNGPDEFAILPVKPLAMPKDLAALPPPVPNGVNLVDPNPQSDAILALGGNPAGGRGLDAALAAYAGRGGVTQDIRAVLAAEDLDYRQRNNGRLLERLFNVTTYFKAYRSQSLDQNAELARWRAQGLATPSAPPANP